MATPILDVAAVTRGAVVAVVTVAVLAALEAHPSGPVAAVLAVEPMTYLGRISYGTYLWHWPRSAPSV